MRRLVLAALILAAPADASEEDKGFLAGLISRALSSRATQVSVGAVEGALSSDAVIRDVVLADRDGPWLKIDRAALSWNRLALFKRRLEVERLEIGHISWLRPARKENSADPGGPMEWPDLPLKAIVKSFRVESLELGAPVLGEAARLGFTGSATLGSPSEGLDLAFAARRLDAPGGLDLTLNFTPKTTALTLALDAEEPAGGLLAKAAHLPQAPPVTFRFDGAGPLDAFHARLDFAAGPEIGAQGGVDLLRDGAGRRLKLALTSRLAGLVPELAAPVLAGQTKLTGEAKLGDDGSVTTQGIGLESEAASLALVGAVTAKGEANVTVDAHAKPNDSLGKLSFLATIAGALPRPAVSLSLDVQGLKSRAGTLAQASARFAARPETPGDSSTALGLTGDASFAGLKLADPALAPLVGETGRLALQARATADGAVDVTELKLDAEALRARFTGKAAAGKLDGVLDAEAPDLSRLAALTGLALKGSARGRAKVAGVPARGDYTAEVTADAERFATGIGALDGFAGARPALAGGLKVTAAGYGFDKLTLTGAGGAARLDGAQPIRAALTIPDARRLDSRVEGEIAAQASLAGSDLELAATLAEGRLLGRPARLQLTAQARGGASLGLKLGGDIDGKPLSGEVAGARAEDALKLDRLSFALGKARLDGAGRFAKGLIDGRLALAAPRLDDLSPLALTPLSGAAKADIGFAVEAGRQNMTIRAESTEAGLGAARIGGLAVDLRLADLYGDLSAEGSAAAARIVAGGETVSAVKLTAKGERFDFAATARGLALNARGALRMAAKTLRLDALTASGRAAIALAEPATLKLGKDGVETERLALRLGAGRVTLQGLAGRRLDLTAKAEAAPLALADIVSPGLGLTGSVSGEARLQGDASAPTGDWRLILAGLSAPAARNAGLPPLEVKASGRLGQGRTSLEATASAGSAGSLRLSGSAPLGEGALDLKASGRLELAPLTRTLAARGQRLSGTVTLDARVTGDLAKPRAEGGATLVGGAFSDDLSGLRLSELSASVAARGDRIEIARASGRTPGGGSVSASGRVRLEPNFPGEIHLSAENARLVTTDIVTAEAGLALDVSGPLASAPRVAGRIDVKALDVEIPGRLPGSAAPLADVRHIDPGPAAKRRLALMQKARARGGPAFDAALAIAVSAPSRVTVHGRGVDAEFGGELKIGGTAARPQVAGGFDLRRGSLTLIGGPLSFARGAIRFEGDTLPRLDLEARQTLSDATAIVDITGPADKPAFAFTSSPELPQDEVLSRLLFQKPSGSLSAFQALQLANTIAALSGGGGALDSLRRSLGVDSLDVFTGSGGGPVLGARRAIGDRLSLGVKTGAKPQDNGVTLDLDVTKRLRLSTGVDAKGESSVGAGMQWEY